MPHKGCALFLAESLDVNLLKNFGFMMITQSFGNDAFFRSCCRYDKQAPFRRLSHDGQEQVNAHCIHPMDIFKGQDQMTIVLCKKKELDYSLGH